MFSDELLSDISPTGLDVDCLLRGHLGSGDGNVDLRLIGQIKARCFFEFSCVVLEMCSKLLVGNRFIQMFAWALFFFSTEELVGCYFCTIQRYCNALVCLTKFQNIVIHNCADSCSGSL